MMMGTGHLVLGSLLGLHQLCEAAITVVPGRVGRAAVRRSLVAVRASRERAESEQRARNRVHGARAKEFEHLQEVDVNELCARVVVMGVKPST